MSAKEVQIRVKRGEQHAYPIDEPFARLSIVLEPNSQAMVIIGEQTIAQEHIQISLEQGAKLELVHINPAACVIDANLAADATFHTTMARLTDGNADTRINVTLQGPGSSARVNGLVIASSTDQAAFTTRIHHLGEHTSSDQIFKYIADGESQCSFDGLIIVDQAAKFTEAYQTNHNLLASPDARMHSEPALEIYCDDVKCSHGATTGQLDAQALFYMRSRGIPEAEAKRMLMEAFVHDVIDAISHEQLRERLRQLVANRFSSPC